MKAGGESFEFLVVIQFYKVTAFKYFFNENGNSQPMYDIRKNICVFKS
jgi:hypothetical protein